MTYSRGNCFLHEYIYNLHEINTSVWEHVANAKNVPTLYGIHLDAVLYPIWQFQE